MSTSDQLTYASAGVDIAAADDSKHRIKKLVESTFTAGARGAFGCVWVHCGAFGCISVRLGAWLDMKNPPHLRREPTDRPAAVRMDARKTGRDTC